MKKVMHIAIFSREIKKLVEFRLPAILVVSLAWLALPITAGGRARATRATTAKEVSLAATAQLNKLPGENQDQQLPASVRSLLKQYRNNLKQASRAEKLSDAQIKQLANEGERDLDSLRAAVKGIKEAPPKGSLRLRQRIDGCGSAYDRRMAHAQDSLGAYICSLDAEGCIFQCVLGAFGRGGAATQ